MRPKFHCFKLRFTEQQLEQLRQKAIDSGFRSIAVYIRYQLFFTLPLLEKAFRMVKE